MNSAVRFLLFLLPLASANQKQPQPQRPQSDLAHCRDLHVSLKANEFRIPFFPKEHYIEVEEVPSGITCTLKRKIF